MKKSTWISIIALLISIIGVLIALVAYFKRKRSVLCDDFGENYYDEDDFDFFEDELENLRDVTGDVIEDTKGMASEAVSKIAPKRGRKKGE